MQASIQRLLSVLLLLLCWNMGAVQAQKRFDWVIPPQFDRADHFVNGVACVTQGDSVYFINQSGKRLHAYAKRAVSPFADDMARFDDLASDKCGFIDRSGQIVIPARFNHVNDFSDGVASVVLNGKMGLIDKTGAFLIPIGNLDLGGGASEGLINAYNPIRKKWGYVDYGGKTVIPFIYDDLPSFPGALPFRNGLAVVSLNKLSGYIDKTGKMVIKNQYSQARDFSGGLASVVYKGKWGFIDKTGQFVIQPKYDSYPSDFSEGYTVVNAGQSDKPSYVFLDPQGNEAFGRRFGWAQGFNNGVAAVRLTPDSELLYINTKGEQVQLPNRDSVFLALEEVGPLSDGLRAAKKDGKWGYMRPKPGY